ncbi:MAG: hypothetical protein EAX95_08700 [Candidatus Thorarchaeota archaeon]|nr:hypothetical protein [Candidatus Thorarchaeota archaeon]
MEKNPFTAILMSEDTMVTVKEGDEEKHMDAKREKIRYMVGESQEKRFIDGGKDAVQSLEDKTVYLVPSIHRLPGDPFHYDATLVERVAGKHQLEGATKLLNRHPACDSHDVIEVTYESPGVECCTMTKEEADNSQVPLQYVAGYFLGKKNGLLKVALSKTTIEESGKIYYDNIRVIPEAVIREMNCLE